jgi:hypothetical protein
MQQQAARGIVVASLRGRGCRGGRHRPLHAFACESAEHIAADERTCGMRLKQSEKSVNAVCQAKNEGQGERDEWVDEASALMAKEKRCIA